MSWFKRRVTMHTDVWKAIELLESAHGQLLAKRMVAAGHVATALVHLGKAQASMLDAHQILLRENCGSGDDR